MIEITNLKKVWESDGVTVLDDINLSIHDGEIYALVGRSGAGKSTLLRCINGLTSYQEGSLKVDGREVRDLDESQVREFRRHMGMIFQQFSLLERETVYQNVALPMKCWKYSKSEIDSKVMELLELVGLADKKDAKPRNLSGGQKQRVAIARALTMEPKYLLCDEATSALDPKTTNSILDLLMKINRKIGITIIIVTHQMEVVRRACHRCCILEHGVISAKGSVEEVFTEQPESLQRLLGEEQRNLSASGRNIQICHRMDTPESASLLGELMIRFDRAFPILAGQIQAYRGRDLGIFTINVDEGLFDDVCGFLESRNVEWREVGSVAADETEVE